MSFPSHATIITAGGASSRFNGNRPVVYKKKEFLELDGKSVLYNATLPFVNLPSVEVVVVTYPKDLKEETEEALDNLYFAMDVPIILVEGGATRQESVYNGLKALKEGSYNIEYVLIHDGARPWIDEKTIISTLATATVYGGAAPVLPIHDAIKKVNDQMEVIEHLDRTNVVSIQTPQAFKFEEILEAHKSAANNGKHYFDDTEIFTDFGFKVGVCEGSVNNLKITKASDIPSGD